MHMCEHWKVQRLLVEHAVPDFPTPLHCHLATVETTTDPCNVGPLPRSTRVSRYQKNTHSQSCLCGYYTTSLINFLHLLFSTASYLYSCQIQQSISTTSLKVFFGLPPRLQFIVNAHTGRTVMITKEKLQSHKVTTPSTMSDICPTDGHFQ